MKKLLFLGLLFAGLLIIYGCTTPSGEEALPGEEDGALAGQAISMGCRTVSRGVTGCTTNADGSILVTTRSGAITRTSTLADRCSTAGIAGVAYDYRCVPGKNFYEFCTTQCQRGEQCQSGQCNVLAPQVTVEGTSQPVTVTPNADGTRTVTTTATATAASAPLVQVSAGTDLSVVRIEVSEDRSEVVVNGVQGTHYLYIPVNNNGPFVCPSATTLAEVSPTCSGVQQYTHAQCADVTFAACQIEGSSYKVQVTGSGAGQNVAMGGGCTRSSVCDGNVVVNVSCSGDGTAVSFRRDCSRTTGIYSGVPLICEQTLEGTTTIAGCADPCTIGTEVTSCIGSRFYTYRCVDGTDYRYVGTATGCPTGQSCQSSTFRSVCYPATGISPSSCICPTPASDGCYIESPVSRCG